LIIQANVKNSLKDIYNKINVSKNPPKNDQKEQRKKKEVTVSKSKEKVSKVKYVKQPKNMTRNPSSKVFKINDENRDIPASKQPTARGRKTKKRNSKNKDLLKTSKANRNGKDITENCNSQTPELKKTTKNKKHNFVMDQPMNIMTSFD